MQEMQEMQVWSLGQEDPLEKGMQLTLVFLLGESHGQRSLAVHRVTKSWTQLKRLSMHLWLYHNLGFPGDSVGKESVCSAGDLGPSLGWQDPLEKGTATHSSILA